MTARCSSKGHAQRGMVMVWSIGVWEKESKESKRYALRCGSRKPHHPKERGEVR